MPRVAGIDPGTVSFDLCVLDGGEVVVEDVLETGSLAHDPAPLLSELRRHGPYDLVYGPSGYGLPLVGAADIGERELALMVLVRPDETGAQTGVAGMRSLLRALAGSGLPVVFGPGAIHLPTVPAYRKRNRIDLGTADKVCAAAAAIADQCARLKLEPADSSLILLELGGAFSAALAVDRGRIVDGAGGSSGPPGVRAAGALDGEVAYLLGPSLRKRTLFSGGALDTADAAPVDAADAGPVDLAAAWGADRYREGWAALLEGAAKAARALTAVVSPREIVVSGRLARVDGAVAALAASLESVAPTRALITARASVAAHGGALLADGLAGGRYATLVQTLALRGASGTALDHLRVLGSDTITLG